MKEIVTNTIQQINDLHTGIYKKLRSSVDDATEIGRLLTEEKGRLEHGEFLPWLKENISFHIDTAYQYMKVFRHKNKIRSVRNLQEAYRLVENLEAQERREKERVNRQKIKQFEQTRVPTIFV